MPPAVDMLRGTLAAPAPRAGPRSISWNYRADPGVGFTARHAASLQQIVALGVLDGDVTDETHAPNGLRIRRPPGGGGGLVLPDLTDRELAELSLKQTPRDCVRVPFLQQGRWRRRCSMVAARGERPRKNESGTWGHAKRTRGVEVFTSLGKRTTHDAVGCLRGRGRRGGREHAIPDVQRGCLICVGCSSTSPCDPRRRTSPKVPGDRRRSPVPVHLDS
mmetsp:Transcript_16745/g.33023  ORF Transcript_16745/g.33023 Transcript_16745/m.33023 type:complete len:219 (+) Transcript_16745:612-1268(+)